MFPFVAEAGEFEAARELVLREMRARDRRSATRVPAELKVGAMLETPSLAFAPDRFFELTDFISVGGNDLKQFFFAADRENELVRRRYDMLSDELPLLPRADRRGAAPRTAPRSPSAARMPGGRSRRWRSPRSASAASRCARPRSGRSRRCCGKVDARRRARRHRLGDRRRRANRAAGDRGLPDRGRTGALSDWPAVREPCQA